MVSSCGVLAERKMSIGIRHYSSGTPLMRTPCNWGPGEVSCVERCPHFRGKFVAFLGNISKVSLINTEVSLFQGCRLRGVHCMVILVACGKVKIERKS